MPATCKSHIMYGLELTYMKLCEFLHVVRCRHSVTHVLKIEQTPMWQRTLKKLCTLKKKMKVRKMWDQINAL